ncbi:hypothetical protein AZH53_05050 [Methanomicrobiaceae archaeon CYW5]|uniref:hypothetical protein n=1 Tax=Methanovulcanius yangii TaxID=1789227 RepID=UPI0029CA2A8F|nr:hypothetical protein [Methanovulcanius yangii]MBT8507784.1 hypothetical protein [Methanovulcanius yangii]
MLLFAIIAAGCTSAGAEVDEARSLMAKGDARLGSVNWDSDPPGIIEAKLVAANIDYENAYASVADIPPGNEDEPDEAYALRELIKSRITLTAAALEIESALVHIMDAEDDARLYQYTLWYGDLANAREDIRAAQGYLEDSVRSLDAITMIRVPVAMQGDIAEAKVTCANLDERAGRLESAIEGALLV